MTKQEQQEKHLKAVVDLSQKIIVGANVGQKGELREAVKFWMTAWSEENKQVKRFRQALEEIADNDSINCRQLAKEVVYGNGK